MSGNVVPRSVLKSPLANGIGRHIAQLQRLTFKFCKSRPDSQGVRDFIEDGLLDFCKAHPETAFYLKPRRHRPPLLVAEYLNGNWEYIKAAKMSASEINRWVEHLSTRCGYPIFPIYKPWSTKNPSIQGVWYPDLNEHPEIVRVSSGHLLLENPELFKNASSCDRSDDSASALLKQLFEQQKHRLPTK